jgi:glutathionylspermidine synthase
MRAEKCTPRPDWQQKCENVGFHFHSLDGLYWDESRCYRFTGHEIDTLDDVTQELLEYNADTPTSLLEASVVQHDWRIDKHSDADQFNSLHEKLIARFKAICPANKTIHLAAQRDVLEDINTTEYLFRVAGDAGLSTSWLFMDEVGWDASHQRFVDMHGKSIEQLFKLYPSEWLLNEDFSEFVELSGLRLLEPGHSGEAVGAILRSPEPVAGLFRRQRYAWRLCQKAYLLKRGCQYSNLY